MEFDKLSGEVMEIMEYCIYNWVSFQESTPECISQFSQFIPLLTFIELKNDINKPGRSSNSYVI